MRIYRFAGALFVIPLLGMMKKCEREVAPVFTLPPTTQTGANTIGFVVDGRVWRNYGWLPYTSSESDNLQSRYVPKSGQLSLSAGQIARNVYETFYLDMDSVFHVGTYTSINRNNPGANYRAARGFILSDGTTQASYNPFVKGASATITITALDTAQHIMAGTFAGVLRNMNDSTQVVRITDGRFDIHYQQ